MQPDFTNPVKLHTVEYGDQGNHSLIILHGLFGSSTNWRSIARELSNKLYVITVDLRNHGMSPWSNSMQYAEMANDVACLIEQRGFSGTTILGHSMGGKTAMALVQTGMTELHKLIVADIAPVPYQHSHSEFVKAMTAVNFTEVRARKDVEKQLEVEISDPMIRQFLMQNLMRQQNRFQWRINLDAIAENMEFLLGYDHKQSSDTDTLFIAGGNSGYIVPDVYPEISRLFPLSKIVTIDNAGHWLHAEQPEKFIKLVWEFINK